MVYARLSKETETVPTKAIATMDNGNALQQLMQYMVYKWDRSRQTNHTAAMNACDCKKIPSAHCSPFNWISTKMTKRKRSRSKIDRQRRQKWSACCPIGTTLTDVLNGDENEWRMSIINCNIFTVCNRCATMCLPSSFFGWRTESRIGWARQR